MLECSADGPPGAGNAPPPALSLQEHFARFRARKMQERRSVAARSTAECAALRSKFVQQALLYLGIPYHAKYHGPESQHFNAPLYLDCCGLVRRVLRDLRADFGFDIGKGNQAYQYDTLPVQVPGPADMQPGDLVFVSGRYFNPQSKQQVHGMVHVEIWLGDGEKTLGARHQRGAIQIHDSFRYESKTYGDMQFHFRSIETWLQGTCRSWCAEHPWNNAPPPLRKSVFSVCDRDDAADDAADEAAVDAAPAAASEAQCMGEGGASTLHAPVDDGA